MLGAISYGAISYEPIVDITLGPLTVSPHGIGIAVGFLVGARFMLPRSRARGMPDHLVFPLFTRAAIGALVGSRVAYVANHVGEYESVADVLKVWEGGISLLGGIVGAILLAMPKMRSSGLSFWKVMDAAVPGLALGILVGRTGDLVVGDHLGTTTDFLLGYRCPPASVDTASPCVPGTVVHQTALYDMVAAGIILAILLALASRRRDRERFDGFFLLVFGLGYGTARLIEDFLREDLRRFGLTGSQMTAITVIALCLFTLLVLRRTPRWGRWDVGAAGPAGAGAAPAGAAGPPTLGGASTDDEEQP